MDHLEDRTLLSGGITTTTGLISAINTANTNGGSTTLTLASGTPFNFTSAYLSTNNVLPSITANITIQGNGDALNAAGYGRLFDVSSTGTLRLENMTLTGGKVSGSAAKGGAVLNSGNLKMTSVHVGGNQAIGGTGQNGEGGGIYTNGASLTLIKDIVGSKLTAKGSMVGASNEAMGGAGGSGQGAGLYVASGTVNISGAAFGGNRASGGANGSAQGGAIYAGGGSVTLTNDLIGVNLHYSYNSTGVATKETFSGGSNSATGGTGGNAQGGGIYANTATLTLTNTTVGFNNANGGKGAPGVAGTANQFAGGAGGNAQGGGIYAYAKPVSISGGTVSNNAANPGGGGTGANGTAKHPTGGAGGSSGIGQGGGVYIQGASLTIGDAASITSNTISTFTITGGAGGAGYSSSGTSGIYGSGGAGGNGGVEEGGNVFVSNATASNAKVTFDGGVLINQGTINGAYGGTGAAGGKGKSGGQGGNAGLVAGGGLYVAGGSVAISGSAAVNVNTLNPGLGGNGGKGGVGGAGGAGGTAEGGGVYALNSSVTLTGGTGILIATAVTSPVINGNTINTSHGGRGGNGGSGTAGAGGNGGAGGLVQGGGVFASGSNLALTLGSASQGATLDDNEVFGGDGGWGGAGHGGANGVGGVGALATGGAVAFIGGKLGLNNATLSDNRALGGSGGNVISSSRPGIVSYFGNGGNAQGGGLFISNSSSALVLNSTIGDNFAVGGEGDSGSVGRNSSAKYGVGGTAQGGGIYADHSTVNILNSTFDDNVLNGAYGSPNPLPRAASTGGNTTGAHVRGGGTAQGGGLYAANGTLSLTNDTIAWNFLVTYTTDSNLPSPKLPGGAVLGTGGGIYNGPANTLNLENTIAGLNMVFSDLAHGETNAYGAYTDLASASNATSGTNDANLIGNGTNDANWAPAIGSQPAGSQQLFAVPVTTNSFGNSSLSGQVPGNYGGITYTLPLTGNNPAAIGTGDPTAASTIASDEGVASSNATDQRGLPRLVNGAIDIGATEMQVDFTGIPSVTTVQAGGTITYTVTVTNGEGVPISPTLTDVIPPNTTYVSGSAAGTGWTITEPSATNSETLTATMPTLNPGATATLSFSVTVNSGVSNTTITDTATLKWTGTNTSGTLSVPMNTTVTGGVSTTSTTLTSSDNPSVYGQPVSFTATVSSSSGTPTGNVVFEDGSTIVGKVALSGGSATFTPSTLSVGSHNITAVYCGDTNDYGSTSNTVTQVVDPDSTATALASSILPSVYGQSVTFTATVAVNGPGAGTPTGTVTFYDGSTNLGTGTLSNGVATFATSTSALPVGNDKITAVYGGDTNDDKSTSDVVTQVVDKDTTTTTVTSSAAPSVYGQSVTFTATVSPVSPGAGTPTGTVTFYDGTTKLGTGTLSGGQASFTTSALSVGGHSITATYGGDTNDNSSTTASGLSQAVNRDQTTTTLSSSSASSVYGQGVTLTATVGVISPGAGTPTGTVTFYDGSTTLGTGTLSGGVATFSTSSLSVGSHSFTASYGGDTNDNGSTTSSAVSETVSQDTTTTTLASSGNTSVYGQPVTFTATVSVVSPGAGTPTGTVTFYDSSTKLGTGTLSGGQAAFTTSALPGGSNSITATYGGDTNDLGSNTSSGVSQTVNPASTTTSLTSSLTTSPLGQNVTFTATVSVVSPGSGTPAGTVEFVDTTTGNVLGTVPVSSSGTASLSVSSLVTGSNVIQAIYSGQSGDFQGSTSSSLTETITQSIIVLSSSANGALKLSGNASINVAGNVIVDSSSNSALSESGNAAVKATSIQVVGGVSTSANATLSPAAVTGIAPVANPLAYLTGPSTSGLTNYGAVVYNTGSHTLNPGIYTSIQASGTASLTLNPGTYIIEGGGMTVTGGASITGSGVTIYNTSSNYPSSTGKYGGVTLSGNGSFSLSAPTSGPYAGIVIFQPSANTRAISLSGNAAAGMTGTIYAPAALLYASGNASVNSALVVNELTLSGNAASTQTAAGTNADNPGDTAGQLLAGDVEVYVNNANGDLTADELARIQDAVNAINTVTSPFGVTVAEVSDPTQANVTLSMGTSSAAGNYGQGVLGCYAMSGQITLIQGWNWYAGSDPSQIGANQYDFQTTVTHELGHALGLGESDNSTSAMYGTLAPATVVRTLTTADMNIPYAEAGADAQMAAPPSVSTVTGTSAGNSTASGQVASLPLGTSVPNSGSPLSVADQLFADVTLLLSDLRNAYQSQLSSVSAQWQQADAQALHDLDALLSLEADAMGMFEEAMMSKLLLAGKSSPSGV